MPTIRFSLYSPRWGHDDGYEIRMGDDRLEFAQGPRVATCESPLDQDPEWDGETPDDILRNNGIYASGVFNALVAWAWNEWRNYHVLTEADPAARIRFSRAVG